MKSKGLYGNTKPIYKLKQFNTREKMESKTLVKIFTYYETI